jgi:hypothetical protein
LIFWSSKYAVFQVVFLRECIGAYITGWFNFRYKD